jgi:carbon storage regulator
MLRGRETEPTEGATVLVLSRSAGESVMIGSDVVVTVLEVRGDVVRIGIDAPRSVRVHREEVYRALEEANRAAAGSSGGTAEAALSAHLATPAPRPGPPTAI